MHKHMHTTFSVRPAGDNILLPFIPCYRSSVMLYGEAHSISSPPLSFVVAAQECILFVPSITIWHVHAQQPGLGGVCEAGSANFAIFVHCTATTSRCREPIWWYLRCSVEQR